MQLKLKGVLFFVFLLFLAGCNQEVLFSKLEETEANEIVAILDRYGIMATKTLSSKGDVASISVQRDDFAQATLVLRQEGFPKKTYLTTENMFESGGLVTSQLEEQAKLIYAKSQELERTITELDGILSARVHISAAIGEKPGPFEKTDNRQRKAAVVIRRTPDFNFENLVPNIKQMVANSLNKVAYSDVAVIDFIVPKGDLNVVPETVEKPNFALTLLGIMALSVIFILVAFSAFIVIFKMKKYPTLSIFKRIQLKSNETGTENRSNVVAENRASGLFVPRLSAEQDSRN